MAATWPLAARAQQGERIRRIGVLSGLAADDPTAKGEYAAFLQGLQQLGWTDDGNGGSISNSPKDKWGGCRSWPVIWCETHPT